MGRVYKKPVKIGVESFESLKEKGFVVPYSDDRRIIDFNFNGHYTVFCETSKETLEVVCYRDIPVTLKTKS